MEIRKKINLIMIFLILISSYYFYGAKKVTRLKNLDLTNLSFFEVVKGEKFLFSTLGRTFLIEKKQEREIKPFIFNIVRKDKDYFIYLGDNGKLGILDENLNKLTEPIFDTLSNLGKSNFLKVVINDKNYLFNIKTLKEMMEIESASTEGNYIKVFADGKAKLLDFQGRELLAGEYDGILYIKEDRAVVSKDGKYGLVDLNNKSILPIQYEEIYFSKDNFLVKKDGKYYLNDKKLKIENVYPTRSDVLVYDLKEGFSLINLRDKEISKHVYIEVSPNYNNFLIVGNGDKYAIMDKYGKIKPRYIYSYITKIDNETFTAGTDEVGKFALLIGNKQVTDEVFDNIIKISENYFLGIDGNKVVLLDEKGRELLETEKKNLIYYNQDIVLVKEINGEISVYKLERK